MALGLVGLPILLFPNGRPPSPGWRWAGMALVGFIIIWVLTVGLTPGPMTNAGYESVNNPFGVADSLRGLLVIASGIAGFGILISVLACSVSMIVRFRHSRGIEREQVKWLAYAASLIAGLGVIEIVLEATNPTGITARISQLALASSISALPIAAGIVILRYRLYDIDRLVSRTITYAIVTGILAAGYAGGVLLLQLALPVSEESSIVVAATTLAVVALFRPSQGARRPSSIAGSTDGVTTPSAHWSASGHVSRRRRTSTSCRMISSWLPPTRCSPLTCHFGYEVQASRNDVGAAVLS